MQEIQLVSISYLYKDDNSFKKMFGGYIDLKH